MILLNENIYWVNTKHTLLAPQEKQILEDANHALKKIEHVALGIYWT